MVRPDREPEHEDPEQRHRHQPVAEDRLAAHHRDDLGDDPEPGQDHDVDGRVAVEPEDVLVAEDVPASLGDEEVGVQHPVEHDEELRAGDERRRDHDEQRGREVRPHEQRHPPERHARRAHRDDRDEEVERGQDRRGAGPLDAHVEEHLADRLLRRERRVARPAGRERAAGGEEAAEEHRAGDRQEPEGERVEARERHVRRAEHQRHGEVRETGERRDDEDEDHQRGVHGDEAVVGLRVHELHARLRELGAEEHRHQAAEREEDERRREVLDTDHLVVGVDLEVVLPVVRAVVGMVVRLRRPARDPVEPVVERADPEQEADRAHHQAADEHDDVPVVDGIPAREPANPGDEIQPGEEEQREAPGAPNEARAHQEAPLSRRRAVTQVGGRVLDSAHAISSFADFTPWFTASPPSDT